MGEDELRDALLYALGISLAFFLSAFIHNHGFLQAQEVGTYVRLSIIIIWVKKLNAYPSIDSYIIL